MATQILGCFLDLQNEAEAELKKEFPMVKMLWQDITARMVVNCYNCGGQIRIVIIRKAAEPYFTILKEVE